MDEGFVSAHTSVAGTPLSDSPGWAGGLHACEACWREGRGGGRRLEGGEDEDIWTLALTAPPLSKYRTWEQHGGRLEEINISCGRNIHFLFLPSFVLLFLLYTSF